jgi:hypothetical protein
MQRHDAFDPDLMLTRRQLLQRSGMGLGALALGSLMEPAAPVAAQQSRSVAGGLQQLPHFRPRAKRVIFMFMSGGPSQMDLFDYKPGLEKLHGTELPDSIRGGQRLTGMTAGQSSFPVAQHIAPFQRHGQTGTWVSDLLPWHSRIVDDITIVKTVQTEQINHDPAVTFFQTGNQQPGNPSIGAWVTYGLGSENRNLPGFVVLLSRNTYPQAQPLYDRLWGGGFLPSRYQGVRFRSGADAVLHLHDPAGTAPADRRSMLDAVSQLNRLRYDAVGDPEIHTRIAAYEMAYRMQMSVPELSDLADEPESTFRLYGDEAKEPGTFAANCLLARRLAQRGVRFIQLYHRGWDHHSSLPVWHPRLCEQVDRGSAALVLDLKQRGLLEDTLVIWGGEFGRTIYSQGALQGTGYGRDHHPRCFTMWLAGGGIKAGYTHGQTDDYCYNAVDKPVPVQELHATLLHCLGIDPQRFSYRFQGLNQRLIGVEPVDVARDLLA